MTSKFFALAGIFFVALLNPAATASSCQLSEQFDNYVVIGAFAFEKNAINFTTRARRENLPAKFDFNANRNLFYVYVLNTADLQEAIDQANALRSGSRYTDTWVYHGGLGADQPKNVSGTDLHPETEKKMLVVNAVDSAEASVQVASPPLQKNAQSTTATDTVKGKSNPAARVPAEGKSFVFRIYRAVDDVIVPGEVDIVDVEKTKKIGAYQGNAQVWLSMPPNKSGDLSAICELFGYRKVLRTFNYNHPEGDGITVDEAGNIVVPFELVRLQKGDIAVMYNVYFFKDAGVMRPESRYEVTSLLAMLKENPNYRIRIHGHTNGGAAGKIISMGESKSFFSLTGTKDGFGSAKKLSYERAKVIEEFLVSNGISTDRMDIKAWGGKRPIHDKHHARAAENVRVEIEIMAD